MLKRVRNFKVTVILLKTGWKYIEFETDGWQERAEHSRIDTNCFFERVRDLKEVKVL